MTDSDSEGSRNFTDEKKKKLCKRHSVAFVISV